MKPKLPSLPAFLGGIALGAGLALLRESHQRRHPDHTLTQMLVNNALDQALRAAHAKHSLPLRARDRYVIFSDHHKGCRDLADDFLPCEATYLKALDYYNTQNYHLMILGDAEELWEQDITSVMEAYPEVFASEARFHPERYTKLVGNHDDAWQSPILVEQYLQPLFPGLQVWDELVFEVEEAGSRLGELLLVHGQQGTIDSDLLGFAGPRVLPWYRKLQNLTRIGRTTPAEDACLRAAHDTRMYRWASRQGKLSLIAGHTHRPVWSSRTHLEKLLWQLAQLQAEKPEQPSAEYQARLEELQAEIQAKQAEHPPCTDTIKTRPNYFNTGCCRFADGDITGIELAEGKIRLIKWKREDGYPGPIVLEEMALAALFTLL